MPGDKRGHRGTKTSGRFILPQSFYDRDTTRVARDLLGQTLCRRTADGRIFRGVITETEAYLGLKDPAAHSFHGKRTDRVKAMYKAGGHSYVYFIYGMYFCFNVVTRGSDRPEAVLIRAVKPEGEIADQKADGPGKLCRVFQIDRRDDGLPLWHRRSGLWILSAPRVSHARVLRGPRVGIASASEAVHWPLRFRIKE